MRKMPISYILCQVNNKSEYILTLFVVAATLLPQQTSFATTSATRTLNVPDIPLKIVREGQVPAELPGKPPIIDGNLSDPVWDIAAVSNEFWVSAQNRAPSDQTEVFVIQDQNNLYFGFRMRDKQPETIVATRKVRDVGLGYDDSIKVQLDAFLNRRDISEFSVNALGTQTDAIAGGRSSKIQWKGDWQGAAKRTQFGWTAEFAIPFAILNYNPVSTTFGVNFVRYQSRTKEYSYWADVTPQDLNEKMGELTGLQPPEISAKQHWTFMPFVLIGKDIPNKTGEIQDTLATAGLDMRYQPREDLTAMISLNPDFSQVEEAVTDISFSYSEKAVDENRPFFVEGADYFASKDDDNQYFYSNNVADFDAGVKSFGRLGATNYGLLLTKAPEGRVDFVGRTLYEVNDTNSAIATVVGTQQSEFNNLLAVAQFRGRQASGLNYSLDAAATSTTNVIDTDVLPGNGQHFAGSIGWRNDLWSTKLSADRYSANYFPADALLDNDLPGTKGTSFSIGYYRERSDSIFRILDLSTGAYYRGTNEGELQSQKWWASSSLELRYDILATLYAEKGPYRPAGDTPGVFEEVVNHDQYFSTALAFNTHSTKYSGGVQYDWGDLGGGPYDYFSGYAWWRPIDDVYLKLSAERTSSFGTTDQVVMVGSWDINPENSIAGRYIYNVDGNYYRLAYSHRARKGIDIFAVYDQKPLEKPQYSLKIVYTFGR